jgi:hypothetical protein
MPLFGPYGPPDVRKLRAKGDVKGLIKALGYRQADKERAAMVRWNAAQSLGVPGNALAVEPLVAALRDQDQDVRETAAQALGTIGDVRAVEPLVAALRDYDQDKKVRITAAQSLGKIGDARAVEPLTFAVDHDPHDWVRMMAAQALEGLGIAGMQGRAQSRRLLAELAASNADDQYDLQHRPFMGGHFPHNASRAMPTDRSTTQLMAAKNAMAFLITWSSVPRIKAVTHRPFRSVRKGEPNG